MTIPQRRAPTAEDLAEAARRNVSSCLSHSPMRFQLAKFWLTKFSPEFVESSRSLEGDSAP
jgi:hypothetical protein